IQQLAADDPDAQVDETGLNSPVLSANEGLAEELQPPTDSHRPAQRSRSSAHARSTRNDAYAPFGGHDSSADDDDEEDDIPGDDARSKDEDWEPSTSSTRRTPRHISSGPKTPTAERTFTSSIVQALQAARPKKWDKNNIPPYRDHLISEMSHHIKDMDRIMAQFSFPEVDYDDRSHPREVQARAQRAARRLSDHLHELHELKRNIEELDAYWLHWLWSFSPTHLEREKVLRDQYINNNDNDGYASICRRYKEHCRRVRAECGDAEDAAARAKAMIDQQWQRELAQIVQDSRTPTPAPTEDIPAQATGLPVTTAITDATSRDETEEVAHRPTETLTTTEFAAKQPRSTKPTESDAGSTVLRTNTVGKVASLGPSNSATMGFGTGSRSFGDASAAHTSGFSAQSAAGQWGSSSSTLGTRTAQTIRQEPTPRQSLFDFGGGFRKANTEPTRVNNERARTKDNSSRGGQTRQHIRFRDEDEVIPITPREEQQPAVPQTSSREEQLRQFYTPVTSQQNQSLFAPQYAQSRVIPAQTQPTPATTQTRTWPSNAQIQSASANSQTKTSTSTAQNQSNTASRSENVVA
ncbi:hypothetical protein AAVH_31851, partial [Aphelenchoides avenae]